MLCYSVEYFNWWNRELLMNNSTTFVIFFVHLRSLIRIGTTPNLKSEFEMLHAVIDGCSSSPCSIQSIMSTKL
jgi:hypothetical protein